MNTFIVPIAMVEVSKNNKKLVIVVNSGYAVYDKLSFFLLQNTSTPFWNFNMRIEKFKSIVAWNNRTTRTVR